MRANPHRWDRSDGPFEVAACVRCGLVRVVTPSRRHRFLVAGAWVGEWARPICTRETTAKRERVELELARARDDVREGRIT